MANTPLTVDLVGLRFIYQFQVSLSTFFQSDPSVDEYFFLLKHRCSQPPLYPQFLERRRTGTLVSVRPPWQVYPSGNNT